MQGCDCHLSNVFCGDPAKSAFTSKRMKRARGFLTRARKGAPKGAPSKHILHEHTGCQMGQAELTKLDISLDKLMPCKVTEISIVRCPSTHVDNVLNFQSLSLIDNKLTLN